ncbi:hypothetical protein [Metabacillus halosaccharovorans]|uniref:Uncharacterized protein n=1 Tax=Metabacillus halosaccharovorans TaxID=930124 RepID=A0ABT3DNA8_9BACI|nr:hypothetical protein [Metabacillus halosaccharovorans]MCV9888550.1 hypothetical protein [Metabacillus halosaccharovorans]
MFLYVVSSRILVNPIVSEQQNNYLDTVANESAQAAASGSCFVFTISLILAVINVGLSFFIKKHAQS